VIGYVASPRLAPPGAQLYQGDIFAAVPLLHPTADGKVLRQESPGLVLTPTCDFALKGGHEHRVVVAIDPLEPDNPLLMDPARRPVPLHLLLLPPLDALFPTGGVVNFRRVSPIHATRLEACARLATLTAEGVRQLLAAHWRYHARVDLDASSVVLPPDDPRLLWEALDAATAVPSLAERRDSLSKALEVAVAALSRHHGMSANAVDATMARLKLLSERNVLPPATRDVVGTLDTARMTLIELYRRLPRDLQSQTATFQNLAANLEEIALLLQEPLPLQITAQLLRDAGLANLLR
jgi:hypothetical protein